jgi:hypothetical protein
VPERPGDPPPRARALTDRERAEAAQLREIVRKVPPLPAVTPLFPTEPPWSAGLAELAHLWLSVRCECRAVASLPRRGARLENAPLWCRRSPEVHKLRRAAVIGRAPRRRDNGCTGGAKIRKEASAAAAPRFDKAPARRIAWHHVQSLLLDQGHQAIRDLAGAARRVPTFASCGLGLRPTRRSRRRPLPCRGSCRVLLESRRGSRNAPVARGHRIAGN